MLTGKCRSLLFILSSSFWAALVAPAFDIASSGSPRAVIVTGKDPSPVVTTMAAELTNYLGRIVVGANFKISEEPVGGMNAILLGTPYRGKKTDEFAVFVNNKGELELTGEGSRGIVYATYALLEQVGVRFWAHDQETVPTARHLSLPGNFRRVEAPVFASRSLWSEGGLYPTWCAKIRLTKGWTKIPDEFGGVYDVPMGETLALGSLNPKTYYQDHPDWYALQFRKGETAAKPGRVRVENGTTPGTRLGKWGRFTSYGPDGKLPPGILERSPLQICTTNPDAIKQLIAEIRESLAKKPDQPFIPIGMNDTGDFCACERCAALWEAHGRRSSARIVDVANRVGRAIAKDYPKTRLVLLAYGDYTEAPPLHMTCEPNVCVAFAHGMYLEDKGPLDKNKKIVSELTEWTRIAPAGVYVWAYYACFAHYILPYQDFDYMGPNFRLYQNLGVKGIFAQLPWGSLADFLDLRCWLYGQLAWNPDQDENKLIGEWIDGTCGKGAPFMRDYMALRIRVRTEQKQRPWKDRGFTVQDNLKAYELFRQALAATQGDEAAHTRVEKLSAGMLMALIANYNSMDLAAAAKVKGFELPTRVELIDHLSGLAKKYKCGYWNERDVNFPDYLEKWKTRK